MVLERARRLVEMGKDVIIVLDSLTRMARAHNTAERGSGRTLSGGLDATNVAEALARTGIGAVDVSSGVESAPGAKDPDRIAAFVAAARGRF